MPNMHERECAQETSKRPGAAGEKECQGSPSVLGAASVTKDDQIASLAARLAEAHELLRTVNSYGHTVRWQRDVDVWLKGAPVSASANQESK